MLDRREPLAPTELMMATRELDLLRTLAPTLQEPHPLQQLRDVDWMDQEEAASPENLDRPSKWQKPGPKGAQHGKGKNRGPPQLPRYDSSWRQGAGAGIVNPVSHTRAAAWRTRTRATRRARRRNYVR